MDMKTMMAQAKKIQAEMERKKAELAKRIFEVNKQGVAIKMNGTGEVVSVKIEPLLLDPEDPEIVEGLIVIAINDLKSQLDEAEAALMPKGAY